MVGWKAGRKEGSVPLTCRGSALGRVQPRNPQNMPRTELPPGPAPPLQADTTSKAPHRGRPPTAQEALPTLPLGLSPQLRTSPVTQLGLRAGFRAAATTRRLQEACTQSRLPHP